ncbi:MAG TPA: glycosyltransferase [Spirochaetota bacterium]|nr:glycosyltransferase [Spirochaetota bacterium]
MTLKKIPLVSICIPTYNGNEFIAEALKSALAQTYKNTEIIISDDRSSDGTLAAVKKILKNTDIPYKIIEHSPSGIGANWNNCVINSNGEYIKFLFQDDTLEPECIEKMVKLAEMDKNIGLVFSKRNFIYKNRTEDFDNWIDEYSNLHIHWNNLKEVNSGKNMLRNCPNLLNEPKNKVSEPPAVLLRKKVFFKTGYFNENLKQALDYEFWYRVFKHYKIGFIDECLINFRLHQKQTTQKNKGDNSDFAVYTKLLYENLFWQLHPKIKKNLLVNYNPLFKRLNKIYNYFRNKFFKRH